MMKAAVLSFLLVGCSALSAKKVNPKDKNGITYSYKAKDQEISNKRILKDELAQIVKDHSSGAQKDVGPIEDYLDLWYVNMKQSKDRRQCMDKQIEEMGMKPHIYAGLNFHKCIGAKDPNIAACLTDSGYGDCVKRGLNPQGIATHGSKAGDDIAQAYRIVSNACSHKRALAHMLKTHRESKSKAKYAVLMEDDVIFYRGDFVRKIVNFAETYDGKYNETWTMVQIDPFGSKCDKHIAGYFEGMPVWKPTNVNNNHECSNYWGAQALLVKYDTISKIITHMETHPTIPLDWLPAELDHGLAWRADIAKNPEMVNQFYAGEMHHQWVNLPDYCKKSVKESTIGASASASIGKSFAEKTLKTTTV